MGDHMKIARATIIISSVALLSCVSPKITKQEASELPPYTLCKEYRRWSDTYASPAADVDRKKTAESLKMIYEVISKRNIDCNKELQIEATPSTSEEKSMINCIPNQVTGGITCF
jgi:hypothetical protein